jgi:hypothetical protein
VRRMNDDGVVGSGGVACAAVIGWGARDCW